MYLGDLTIMLPTSLFHGSGYWAKELKPGFERSGELVRWDETEDNTFLYATTDREKAIVLGFASALEKKYGLDRFQHMGDKLILDVPRQPHGYTVGLEQLYHLELWLYELTPHTRDGWQLNKNEHNGMRNTEYKTKNTIRNIRSTTPVDVRQWLSNYKVEM